MKSCRSTKEIFKRNVLFLNKFFVSVPSSSSSSSSILFRSFHNDLQSSSSSSLKNCTFKNLINKNNQNGMIDPMINTMSSFYHTQRSSLQKIDNIKNDDEEGKPFMDQLEIYMEDLQEELSLEDFDAMMKEIMTEENLKQPRNMVKKLKKYLPEDHPLVVELERRKSKRMKKMDEFVGEYFSEKEREAERGDLNYKMKLEEQMKKLEEQKQEEDDISPDELVNSTPFMPRNREAMTTSERHGGKEESINLHVPKMNEAATKKIFKLKMKLMDDSLSAEEKGDLQQELDDLVLGQVSRGVEVKNLIQEKMKDFVIPEKPIEDMDKKDKEKYAEQIKDGIVKNKEYFENILANHGDEIDPEFKTRLQALMESGMMADLVSKTQSKRGVGHVYHVTFGAPGKAKGANWNQVLGYFIVTTLALCATFGFAWPAFYAYFRKSFV